MTRIVKRHFMPPWELRSLIDSRPYTFDDGDPVHRVKATPDRIAELLGLQDRVHVTGFGYVVFTTDKNGEWPVAIIFPDL